VLPPTDTPSGDADLAVTATVEPRPGYTGTDIRTRFILTNAGPAAAEDVVLTTAWPDTREPGDRTLSDLPGCTEAEPCTIPAGGRLVIDQTAVYDAEVNGTVRGSATSSAPDPDAGDNGTTARLRVLQPEITLAPEVGTPGEVAMVRGEDFPPGATVTLDWNPGLTAARSPIVVGEDGTFEAQMLVLRKDRTGPRTLRAEVAASGIDPLEEEFLVGRGNLQPPDFAGRD
jgi:hypothetical protein